MGRNGKTGREQAVLYSIVARLLSLADLGERAACRSPWVRFCVLWSLCQADAIVREFVAGSTWNPAGRQWSPALPMVRYGTEPADALNLAASLRALALIVQSMAAQIRRLAFLHPGQASAGWSLTAGSRQRVAELLRNMSALASWKMERIDTS